MKSIALESVHRALGAKMAPFAGFEMPIQYEGLQKEHLHVRQKVGVFDVSHMGEFFVRGEGAEEFLQTVTTNDVAKLYPGKVQYSCLPNHKGGIVDDLLVYKLAENEYLLVVNAANLEKDFQWLAQHCPSEVELEDRSDDYCLFAVQGPEAGKAIQSLTDLPLGEMQFYTFATSTFAGVEGIIVSATGYTGAGGFEVYVPRASAEKVWQAIFKAGAALDIKPIGLGARDTLRLEMGFCLYGNDIDDTTSPIEAGLGWITKFTKDFISAETFKAQKENHPSRRLVGLVMLERGIPRQGYPLVNAAGEKIGEVTSGTMSPSLGKAIGMGYVPWELRAPGNEIYVEVRNKRLKAEVVRPPFLKS